ncbi:MAG: hypothetical protein GX860_10770 [Alcaligenaceae bacterium]|nr:hypothetical protein [Alcaligenaceae bacterium]
MIWSFPSNNNGEIAGISNSGIETFKGNPLPGLAREICQNSLDAAINENDVVNVEFNVFNLDKENFPDYNGLRKVFNKSLNIWKGQSDDKSKRFFENGLSVLSIPEIPCIRISDSKTIGLEGVNEMVNSPWVNLTKSSGVSDKNESAGGSFGIGKFASYACSDLRTVFYNTINIEGERAFQGISRLTSFFLDNENKTIASGIGFFGSENNIPLLESKSLDDSYKRDESETGTDIFILGFNGGDNWRIEILKSILDGFLIAIMHKKLKVKIDNITLDNTTINEIIKTYGDKIGSQIKDYYKVLISEDTKWFQEDFLKMGEFKFGVLKDDSFQNKIAMIRRSGMKIFDKKIRFAFMNYSAVLIIQGTSINSFLRGIENPQHTKWEPKRSENQKHATGILKQLNSKIEELLNSLNDSSETDSINPVIEGYLVLEDDEVGKEKSESLSSEIKEVEVRRKKVVSNRRTASEIGFDDKDDIAFEHNGETLINNIDGGVEHGYIKSIDLKHQADESDGFSNGKVIESREKSIYKAKYYNLRIFSINKSEGEYIIQFSVKEDLESAVLEIKVVAESHLYDAQILYAYNGKDPNIVYRNDTSKLYGLNCTPNGLEQIFVKIDHDDYCSMEVSLYGNK